MDKILTMQELETKFSPIKSRIIQFIDYKGIKKSDFFKLTGISASNFKAKGAKSELGGEKIVKILSVFPELNPEWLVTGKGPMLRDEPARTPEQEQIQTFTRPTDKPVPVQDIPLYDMTGAAGLNLFDNATRQIPVDSIRIPHIPKADGAIFITGDSMYPILKSGDIVIFKKIQDIPQGIIWGEIYLIDAEIGGLRHLMVKYLQKGSDPGQIVLVSHNEHHQPMEIPVSSIRNIAKVLASIRFHTMT